MWVPDWLSKEDTWPTGSLRIASGFYDLVPNSVAQELCDSVGSNLSSQFYQTGGPATRVLEQYSIGSVHDLQKSERTKNRFAAIRSRHAGETLQVPVLSPHAASSTRSDKLQATSLVREKEQLEIPITRRQLNRRNSRRAAKKASKTRGCCKCKRGSAHASCSTSECRIGHCGGRRGARTRCACGTCGA